MGDGIDDVLFNILRECKTLPNFLDHIFGFLRRRTDFYVIAPDPNSPVGLPKGLAEYFVKQAFMKYLPQNEEGMGEPNKATVEEVQESIVKASPSKCSPQKNTSKDFDKSECYNGALYENYTWSQSITDVDVIIKVPEDVTPRDLDVKILPNSISVRLKNSNTIILEGELCKKCKNDPIWSLDKNRLEIHLEKVQEIWWDCLVQSEPKLDISKIDCSRPFEELPEEAQSKIEELTWNQERKRLGLPTSDELAMQEKLKKSWNCEGSPFKGPYDPNAVIFN